MDLSGGTKGNLKLNEYTKTQKVEGKNYFEIPFNKEDWMLLGNDDGELDYIPGQTTNNIHIGQLKLLISELVLFVYYSDDELKNVIYAGAAEGYHIYILSKMFPDFTFYLYDTRPFDKRLKALKNVNIYNKYFLDEDIEHYKKLGLKYFLISDIRNLSMDQTEVNKRINEELIVEDMLLQQSWVKKLKPVYSLLKFKLPYGSEDYNKEKYGETMKYLDGQVFKQAFAKPLSAETRLLVTDNDSSRDWNLISYENKMSYHNRSVRERAVYLNPINNSKTKIYEEKGLYNDYDSTYFTQVVMDYLYKINKARSEENVKNIIDYILDNIYPNKAISNIRLPIKNI